MAQPSPQIYYEVLHGLLLDLFGHDWHLGYWLNATSPAEAAERLNEVMLNRLPVKEGMSVLDVGCGVGGPACFIAEKTRCQVVGVSNSRLGLAEAERFVRERGLQNLVTFQFAEALEMPFPDESFDAVWSCEALHNFEDKRPFAREVARVLKPGGCAVLGDLFLLKEPDDDGPDLRRLGQFSFHLVTADALIETLRAEGINVDESISIGHHVGPQSPEICAQICREKAARYDEKNLARMILERTVDATSLLAESFARREVSWGIWVGTKSKQ
ncbi:MAG: methyltransferase domain-containing protein [Acidobacteria bacterium]|nr:methyltransferase domain-containing protein [Acidobacteriota bacterium]